MRKMSVYDDRPGDMHGDVAPWHRWQDWINLILGIWLFISPWFWAGPIMALRDARSDSWLLGVIVIIMALWALSAPTLSVPEWIMTVAGVWLFIAPWVLIFSMAHPAAWSHWIVGVIVFLLAISAAREASGPTTTMPGKPVTGM
jgi:hypothetical protein